MAKTKLMQVEKRPDVKTAVVVAAIEKKVKPILKKIPDKISTKEQFKDAADNMKVVKAFVKEATQAKQDLIDPLNKVIAGIKELFAPIEKQAKNAETTLKLQMSIFVEETKKKLKQIEDDLDSGKIKKVTTAIGKQNAITIDSNIRKVWTAIPMDESKTPREYLVPDEQAITKALKAGKKVAGWEWKKVDQIVI